MPEKVLTSDLDNCLINFDRKVVVTNLLDEYGGVLEEIAKTVNEFLSAEEEKGKKFEKIFMLRGLQTDSENEVITLVAEDKLKQRKQQLRDAHSMLYSAETAGGSKQPPYEFVPLKHISVKLNSLVVKDAAVPKPLPAVNEQKQPAKKTGALGTMFKKQEQEKSITVKKSPEKSTPKKVETEKKTGALGAMFKKQETATKKSPKSEPEKKSNTLGAMFKKQESSTATKKSPDVTKAKTNESKKPAPASKKGMSSFLTKKETTVKPKSSVTPPKKEDAKKIKEEPEPVNVSVNLFDEASSSEDEEALDALKRQVLTDDEEDKPSTSNKRRRIIDSDDEDAGPETKVERKEEDEVLEILDESPAESSMFMDDDGFIVTKKAKIKKPAASSKRTPTPVKVKKESPKSPTKKETASTAVVAKKKQGNIMNFFAKK